MKNKRYGTQRGRVLARPAAAALGACALLLLSAFGVFSKDSLPQASSLAMYLGRHLGGGADSRGVGPDTSGTSPNPVSTPAMPSMGDLVRSKLGEPDLDPEGLAGEEECSASGLRLAEDKCAYVREKCAEMKSNIDYLALLYCPGPMPPAVTAIVLAG